MAEQETPRVAPPGVTEYLQAVKAADAAHEVILMALETAFLEGERENAEPRASLREVYYTGLEAADAEYKGALQAAWEGLKASTDPLVKWIAENCEDWRDSAMTVLKALPATLEELDELAEVKGWCDTWDSLRGRAADAGVIAPLTAETAARKVVFKVVAAASCDHVTASSRKRINEALDALISEALKAATTDPEASA